MEEKIASYHQRSRLFGFWMQFPVWLRAILLGISVSTLGVGVWVLLVSFTPVYVALTSELILIILYIRYFSGIWVQGNTSEFRQICSRRIKVGKASLKWSLLASISLLIFLNATLVLTFRLVQFHPETFKTANYLTQMSPFMAWSLLFLASLVAGVCEEMGFRGYMQVPMERKYGVTVAIIITSLMFVVVHLHQAWAGGILPQIFLASVMIGLLAYATQSLVFGMVVHTLFDIGNFSYWWSDLAGTFSYKPISITGVDAHFIMTLIVFLASTILCIASYRKLILNRKQ